jgi:DTW domain-containing protein
MNAVSEPRAVCGRCRRPESVCYCRHVTTLETKTRVVLLQHPRERDVAIGTAHMASLCLAGAELHVGVSFGGLPALARALSDPARPAILLYPGEGAIDVVANPPEGPVTLVVVDGTWWQARKVVRQNPELAALPRYTFRPPRPSEYRIRREPQDDYVSTIEALVHVLGVLEGDRERFEALLTPFRAMIDTQLACQQRFHGARVRHAKKALKTTRPRIPALLCDRGEDLVCVVGEANAQPYCARANGVPYEDELVHWVAYRVSTGETFDFVVAPKNPLAPRTTSYIGLSESELAAGGTMDGLTAAWRAFVRDTDVVCSWGRYATALFAASDAHLPPARLDLRQVARVSTSAKVGTLDELVERVGVAPTAPLAGGRAGRRLAQVVEVARYFSAQIAPPLGA